MILPSKHISQHRALFSIGAVVLNYLTEPMTVSALWEAIHLQDESFSLSSIHYTTYVLTLDLLFMIGAVGYENGLLHRSAK